jgi:hypothetical protein
MNDKKLNLNPKRLITFERRMIDQYKSEIIEARKSGEYDYEVWLTARMSFSEKILNKKILRIERWVAKQELLSEFSINSI